MIELLPDDVLRDALLELDQHFFRGIVAEYLEWKQYTPGLRNYFEVRVAHRLRNWYAKRCVREGAAGVQHGVAFNTIVQGVVSYAITSVNAATSPRVQTRDGRAGSAA